MPVVRSGGGCKPDSPRPDRSRSQRARDAGRDPPYVEPVAIDTELQGLDPVDLMEAEATRIEDHIAALATADWHRPSRCDGWTVRDVVAHLAASESYHRACLDGEVSGLFEGMAANGVDSVDSFNAVGVAGFDGVADDEVLRQFVADDADTRRRFRERGDGEVDTSVGLYPARWQAFHLAGELATHADDMFVTVPAEDAADRRDWRARFSRFALREAKPDLVLEVDHAGTLVRGDGIDIELGDDDLVAAVAGRGASQHLSPDVCAALSTMP
jgi:uncharacterized protein (TIGR03083 family)